MFHIVTKRGQGQRQERQGVVLQPVRFLPRHDEKVDQFAGAEDNVVRVLHVVVRDVLVPCHHPPNEFRQLR
jgi:hypothetical protein